MARNPGLQLFSFHFHSGKADSMNTSWLIKKNKPKDSSVFINNTFSFLTKIAF